jgi:glyoxylate/hydroxypyruvate reductase
MNIIITHSHAPSAQRWREEIERQLSQASVKVWSVDALVNDWADFAIGWSPSLDLFKTQTKLQAFFSAAAGVDHLLSNPELPIELPVIRLEDAGMGLQMAEYCLLEVGRQYHQRDRYLAQQRNQKWGFIKSPRRSEFTVGIFGAGVLAKEIVKGLNYFGYRATTFSRSSSQPLSDFLASSQVLILCAPLTDQTRDFFNLERLSQLPKQAYLINVARGALVVDDDLLALLDSNHLSGASLDVFREEPLPTSHRFWLHPKVRMTPHVSAVTMVVPSAAQVADKIKQFSNHLAISGVVDRSRGY